MSHDGIRLSFALEYVYGHSVVTAPAIQWRKVVFADGTPTLLERAPGPLSSIHKQAEVVAVAVSGQASATPGIDIVRYHEKDHPYVYNVDHYTVIEDFHLHPDYERIRQHVGIQDSADLRDMMKNWIFIVGPKQIDGIHWSKTIPKYIQSAIKKAGDAAGN